MDITAKTILGFDPLPVPAAADAAAVAYTTPVAHRYQMGGLGQLEYLRAKLRVAVRLDAAATQGTATVRLTDGTSTVHSFDVDLSQATEFDLSEDVDMGQVSASALLRIEVEVTAAADAGRTIQTAAALELESPFITSNC